MKYAFMGEDTKEATVQGKYYPKDIDIAVMKDDKAIFCLSIKFITSNYKQNANNYFENIMGETANIQANQIPYVNRNAFRNITHIKSVMYYFSNKSLLQVTDKPTIL
jgi:hypothetical protein